MWILEQYHNGKMKAAFDKTGAGTGKPRGIVIDVTALGLTDGDLQISRNELHIEKNEHYTLQFDARSDAPMVVGASVAECHDPWGSDGFWQRL